MNNIRKLRLKRGLLQKQLASLVGVKRVTVTQWEAGRSSPRTQLLPKLAEVLNCDLSDLIIKHEK